MTTLIFIGVVIINFISDLLVRKLSQISDVLSAKLGQSHWIADNNKTNNSGKLWKKSSNNDEESIVSFARISNDQKQWAFSLVTVSPQTMLLSCCCGCRDCISVRFSACVTRLPFIWKWTCLPVWLLIPLSALLFSLSSVSSSCSSLLLLIGNLPLKNHPGSGCYLACLAIVIFGVQDSKSHSSCAPKSYLECFEMHVSEAYPGVPI